MFSFAVNQWLHVVYVLSQKQVYLWKLLVSRKSALLGNPARKENVSYICIKVQISWRSLYTGHVDVRMISKTGDEKNRIIQNHTM